MLTLAAALLLLLGTGCAAARLAEERGLEPLACAYKEPNKVYACGTVALR